MATTFSIKLKTLGFELPGWCLPPSEQLVRRFETRFSLALPADYREFLLQHGGFIGSAVCPFQEPTPCGNATCLDKFYGFSSSDRHDNVEDATKLIDGAPDVIAIGDNLLGAMFWLKCTGKDAGHVYMHDHEGRFAWTDQMFYEWYPNLHPQIRQFLALRREGKLPKKPKGYDHVYRVGRSFAEFFDSLQRSEE